jgi:hypothetical protein
LTENGQINSAKERLEKANKFLIKTIEDLSGLSIFQDTVSDDQLSEIEEAQGGYHYFRFETGGFSMADNRAELSQLVLLAFYSENRDDLDDFSLDIISALHGKVYSFESSKKVAIQKGKQDAYIDEIQFIFRRRIPYGC